MTGDFRPDAAGVSDKGRTDEPPRMSAERVIEVTIGLWDREVPPGQRPPALAADIVDALTEAGYWIVPLVGIRPRTPESAECGDLHIDRADGDEYRCDLPAGHDGSHSQVVRPEQRIAWLATRQSADPRCSCGEPYTHPGRYWCSKQALGTTPESADPGISREDYEIDAETNARAQGLGPRQSADRIVREWRCPKCGESFVVVPDQAETHERLCDGPDTAECNCGHGDLDAMWHLQGCPRQTAGAQP